MNEIEYEVREKFFPKMQCAEYIESHNQMNRERERVSERAIGRNGKRKTTTIIPSSIYDAGCIWFGIPKI